MKISLSENGLGLARNNNFEFTFRKKIQKLLFRTSRDIYTDVFNMQFISSNKINYIMRLRNNVTIEFSLMFESYFMTHKSHLETTSNRKIQIDSQNST